jgi:hypothetical protein
MPNSDNVISLADRVLGECPACREPVLFAENFIRLGRAFAHVSCTLNPETQTPLARGRDFEGPAPPPLRGA